MIENGWPPAPIPDPLRPSRGARQPSAAQCPARRKTITFQIRRARPSDWPDLEALATEAAYRSPDLWPWEASLEDPGFVVAEQDGWLVGALLAKLDLPPVAWVGMAAVRESLPVEDWIARSLGAVITPLTAAGAEALAWMDAEGWADPALGSYGFQTVTRVITLAKRDRTLPRGGTARAAMRRATEHDYSVVAVIDQAAFDPLWWRSEESVRRRAAAASHFIVAGLHGKVVGYAEREQHFSQGHVNRLAVSPSHQGEGIGGALLRRTLERLWDGGAETVSLNTQAANRASHQLYEKFGFAPTGESATVWTLALNRGA